MADGVFNISKGAVAEKIRDVNAKCIIMLLTAAEADATLVDRTDLANLLLTNTESADASYARKVGLTGNITVDNTNDRVDIDITPDPTWLGLTGEIMAKLIIAYEESAADSGRIPLTHHDFTPTTDGSDLTAQLNASGFIRIT